MSGNDFRSEQEPAELARLLPVPAARDLPPGRQRILQEHLMTELHPMEPKNRPRAAGQRRKRRYGLVAVAGSAALAAAIAVTVLMTGPAMPGRHGSSQASGTPTTPETAAVLLARIADAAASQPAPRVRNNQFMYIRSEISNQEGEKLHERQVWLPVANICVTGLLKEGGSTQLLSPFLIKINPDGSEKVEYPSKPSDWNNYAFRCPSEGHLGDTYRLLQSLPTNPNSLLNYLKAQKKYTNDDPVTEIGDLLRENIIPPAVAAAFYRVAAQLPGAILVPDATNAVGQHGIAIAWDSTLKGGDLYRDEWIFDKTTLQYIGERDYNVTTGAVYFQIATQQRAFVNKAGELP
jgi:hypothetical protein